MGWPQGAAAELATCQAEVAVVVPALMRLEVPGAEAWALVAVGSMPPVAQVLAEASSMSSTHREA